MDSAYYLGFSEFPGVGPVKFSGLLDTFGTAERAWNADERQLSKILGLLTTEKFIAFKKTFSLYTFEEKLSKNHINYTTIQDEEYPLLLQETSDRPFVLYYKGDISICADKKAIGIVGTRKISQYGTQITQMITSELVDAGFVIVSGLAFGVDAVAHETTLALRGKTIAVLGSGVDTCTPTSHQKLYDQIIAEGGLIVSSFPIGLGSSRGLFPARNRTIAGLSQGTIVTEGTINSGALYTAKFAREMNRHVFAIPGPITSSLSGATSALLKDGAVLVTSGRDVLDTLGIIENLKDQKSLLKNGRIKGETRGEQDILDILEIEPLHFNEIVRRIGKDSKSIGSILTLMELKGMIQSFADGRYSIS